MSAFQCSEKHVGALTRALFDHSPYSEIDGGRVRDSQWVRIFDALARENCRSLAARYSQHEFSPVVSEAREVTDYPKESAINIIKLARCFAYQACEHAGWDSSSVRIALLELVSAVAGDLPGYDAAPWGY